jgi:hypothetical protein
MREVANTHDVVSGFCNPNGWAAAEKGGAGLVGCV